MLAPFAERSSWPPDASAALSVMRFPPRERTPSFTQMAWARPQARNRHSVSPENARNALTAPCLQRPGALKASNNPLTAGPRVFRFSTPSQPALELVFIIPPSKVDSTGQRRAAARFVGVVSKLCVQSFALISACGAAMISRCCSRLFFPPVLPSPVSLALTPAGNIGSRRPFGPFFFSCSAVSRKLAATKPLPQAEVFFFLPIRFFLAINPPPRRRDTPSPSTEPAFFPCVRKLRDCRLYCPLAPRPTPSPVANVPSFCPSEFPPGVFLGSIIDSALTNAPGRRYADAKTSFRLAAKAAERRLHRQRARDARGPGRPVRPEKARHPPRSVRRPGIAPTTTGSTGRSVRVGKRPDSEIHPWLVPSPRFYCRRTRAARLR